MSFEFRGDKLVSRECEDGERREFDVQEDIELDYLRQREMNVLTLSCGNSIDGESWRSFVIGFLDMKDYEEFCGLLCKADVIEVS